MIKELFDNFTNFFKSPTKPKYNYIYPTRPDGEIVIISDDTYYSVDCFEVIILTGKNRGKHKFMHRRNIIISKGRKPTEEDIKHYIISDFVNI